MIITCASNEFIILKLRMSLKSCFVKGASVDIISFISVITVIFNWTATTYYFDEKIVWCVPSELLTKCFRDIYTIFMIYKTKYYLMKQVS